MWVTERGYISVQLWSVFLEDREENSIGGILQEGHSYHKDRIGAIGKSLLFVSILVNKGQMWLFFIVFALKAVSY